MANEIVNVEQAEAWDGPNGEFWARHQERFDATIAPYHALLLEAAAIAPGERVLDIGCGNGLTSRDAGRATGDRGEVLGVDLSGPMLGLARQLAKDEGLGNIRFEQADAQVYAFPAATFDLVISRFGVMFFSDPAAAFTNIASALRPGGRLAMLVWAPVPDNEWIVAMHGAIAPGQALPKPPPGAPGPFGLADQDFARRTLTAAGSPTSRPLAPNRRSTSGSRPTTPTPSCRNSAQCRCCWRSSTSPAEPGPSKACETWSPPTRRLTASSSAPPPGSSRLDGGRDHAPGRRGSLGQSSRLAGLKAKA